jgi:methanethiol S-methyltransferase
LIASVWQPAAFSESWLHFFHGFKIFIGVESMLDWLIIDLGIVLLYGLQHSLLTTKIAVAAFNRFLPDYTWNFVYSLIAVATLVVGFSYWESSGIYLFRLIPGSFAYHLSTISLALSLFLFFYCFKFTTSFWQWLGVKQIFYKVLGRDMPEYYRLRKLGIKQYIRFPHHTCLVFFFWLHPVMTLDTLFLAVASTIYLYVGTYHQDLRGLRIIGKEWANYRKETALLFPGPRVIKRFLNDISTSRNQDSLIIDGDPESVRS